MKGVKSAPTPATKSTGKNARDALDPLTRTEKTVYCRGTGICMYVGPDRFDIQFAVKLLASDMAHPTRLSLMRLRRLARYLAGTHEVGIKFFYQDVWEKVVVHTDGDWTGDVQTCKSTTGGTIQIGDSEAGHLIESWSITQQVVSLSSAESEFYSLGSGAAQGITVKQVMNEIFELIKGTPKQEVEL